MFEVTEQWYSRKIGNGVIYNTVRGKFVHDIPFHEFERKRGVYELFDIPLGFVNPSGILPGDRKCLFLRRRLDCSFCQSLNTANVVAVPSYRLLLRDNSMLCGLLNNSFPSVEEVVEDIVNGEVSKPVALSRTMAIASSPVKGHLIVYNDIIRSKLVPISQLLGG